MIQIALIENSKEDEALFCKIAQEFFQTIKEAYQVHAYENAEDFLASYKKQFHLVFMDIELEKMNGMDAAKELRKLDSDVILIFLTNLAHYAIAGYEVNAMDYILKPITPGAFHLKIPKALALMKQQKKKNIHIFSRNEIHTFSTDELYYVEVQSHRLYYHTSQGIFDVRGAISDVEEDLYPFDFRRCHHSFLVNLKFVTSIQGNEVLVGGDILQLSRPKKKVFINELTNYLGGQL